MPNYFYTAKSFDGKTQTGNLNARDIHQLAQDLKDRELILIKAASDGEKKKRAFNFSMPSLRVSLGEKIMFTRNLWVMVSAGLSLVKSFDILSTQTKSKRFRSALLVVRERINKGDELYEALSEYPDIFSELFLNMVKVGEETGAMEESFKALTLQMEKEHLLKSKIQQAMIYPSVILTTMLGIGILITIVVLPRLSFFFSSMNVDLPIYTKIIIGFGGFASKYWYVIILAVLILPFIFLAIIRTKNGKKTKDGILLKMPIFSSLVKKNNAAFMIRSLSSLISSGVPLVRSLEITAGVTGNFYFKKAISESAEKVKKGEKLSGALKSYQDIFPVGAVEMIEVGEETGKTSVILKKLADFYEQEAITITENLSLAIEPALILVLGLAVAFFAFSIIQPMYSVLGSIQ